MRTSGWISALVASLVLGWKVALPAADPESEAEKIAALVAQLGSAKHQDREAATLALDVVGAPALPALRSASRSEDAEIRRRAEDLVLRIDRRLEVAKLLEPKRLRLAYKDTSVPEAVRDLARRTGYPIQLQADPVSLAFRKVTVQTDDLPFWEALEQFCHAAGLVERDLLPNTRPTLQVADGAGRIIQRGYESRSNLDTRWVLVEGKMPLLPGCRSSSVRVLALPSTAPIEDRLHVAGEYLLTLDVMPEARIQWQSILEVRIDRAIDEHDQALAPALSGSANPLGGQLLPGNGIALLNPDTGLPLSNPRRYPVRLQSGILPTKRLKEVSGTIAAQVQTPLQPLITVDNLLKSAGQIFRGAEGESLKIVELTRQPDGTVRLRLEVEQPMPISMLGGGAAILRGNRAIAMNGRGRGGIVRDLNVGGPPNLTLSDAAGQPIPLEVTESELTAAGSGMTQRLLLVYRRSESQPEAAKLVLHGRRTLLLEVPFTLLDVPIP
jgi:hypothetical protein